LRAYWNQDAERTGGRDPLPGGFSGSGSQGDIDKLEAEPKMEIIKFLFEFGVVTVVISAIAALKLPRN
jgi:hypothetical protein